VSYSVGCGIDNFFLVARLYLTRYLDKIKGRVGNAHPTVVTTVVTDQNHVRAVKLANQIETDKTRLVTIQAILLEIGNSLV
jgi:hypothetical protein